MSQWTPDMPKSIHPVGSVMYLRVVVTGHDDDGCAYVEPIERDRRPATPRGSLCVDESWLLDGRIILDAMRKGATRKALRYGRVNL